MGTETRHFDDIGWTVVADIGEAVLSFKAYEIAGHCHSDESPEPCILDDDDPDRCRVYGTDKDDWTREIGKAEVQVEGDVKFDGCVNIATSGDIMWHGCGRADVANLAAMLLRVHDWGRETVGKGHDDLWR